MPGRTVSAASGRIDLIDKATESHTSVATSPPALLARSEGECRTLRA